MTPLDLLGTRPEEVVMVHEIGHLIMTHDLKLAQRGIRFFVNDPHFSALANSSDDGVSADKRIMRELAGLYCQRICRSETVSGILYDRLVKGHLVVEKADLQQDSPLWSNFVLNRSIGDWQQILADLSSLSPQSQEQAAIVNRLLRSVRRRFCSSHYERLVEVMLIDLGLWLQTHHEDAPFWRFVIYPGQRGQALFDEHRHQRAASARR